MEGKPWCNINYLFVIYSHDHRLSRWLAQPYKGMLLAGGKSLFGTTCLARGFRYTTNKKGCVKQPFYIKLLSQLGDICKLHCG